MIKFKRNQPSKKSRIIFFLLTLFLIRGIIFGILSALFFLMNPQNESVASTSLINYINVINAGETNKGIIIFQNSLFKYGRTAILLWLPAFFKFGGIIILPVFMQIGIKYGFTTTLLIKLFGYRGTLYATLLYMPQGLILLVCCYFLAYSAMRFSIRHKGKGKKGASRHPREIKKYLFKLAIALSVTVIISGLDVFALWFIKGRL
jgi:uncharacterized membrane protein SpoIIM required for sporulation